MLPKASRPPYNDVNTVYEVLSEDVGVEAAAYRVGDNLDVLASHIKLAKLEPQLQGAVDAYRLREALDGLPHRYLIIDCPPSLGALTTNALVAASHVLVPVNSQLLWTQRGS